MRCGDLDGTFGTALMLGRRGEEQHQGHGREQVGMVEEEIIEGRVNV